MGGTNKMQGYLKVTKRSIVKGVLSMKARMQIIYMVYREGLL